MKKLLSLLILSACSLFANAECCPQPPQGYECVEWPLALMPASAQIPSRAYYGTTDMMIWNTHVTKFIAIENLCIEGWTYEVQYTDSLDNPLWRAQVRVTVPKTDTLTTHIPIFPCVQQRFFRVCAQAPSL